MGKVYIGVVRGDRYKGLRWEGGAGDLAGVRGNKGNVRRRGKPPPYNNGRLNCSNGKVEGRACPAPTGGRKVRLAIVAGCAGGMYAAPTGGPLFEWFP